MARLPVQETHVSSNASGGIALFNTEYWEEFSENVSAIFTDLIIAKNAQLAFMQGNRIIIVDEDNGITAGISGYSDGIRFGLGRSSLTMRLSVWTTRDVSGQRTGRSRETSRQVR